MSNTLENRVKAVVARYEEAAPFDGATFYIGDSGDVFKSRPFTEAQKDGMGAITSGVSTVRI